MGIMCRLQEEEVMAGWPRDGRLGAETIRRSNPGVWREVLASDFSWKVNIGRGRTAEDEEATALEGRRQATRPNGSTHRSVTCQSWTSIPTQSTGGGGVEGFVETPEETRLAVLDWRLGDDVPLRRNNASYTINLRGASSVMTSVSSVNSICSRGTTESWR